MNFENEVDTLRRQIREMDKLLGIMQLMDFHHAYTDDNGVERYGTPLQRMVAKVPGFYDMYIAYCLQRRAQIIGTTSPPTAPSAWSTRIG